MRPAGKGPLESLYFTYPHFPARAVPELSGASAPHPVVIAGAGPVGMVAALTLARYGIRSVLLDRKDTFNDGSRAICIARASMQILESVGAVGPFLEKALGWTHGRSYFRGREILRFAMPDAPSEKYRPMYNLQQQYIEAYLHEAVAASPLIDMRWQSEVTEIEAGDDGVTLGVETPLGAYRLRADYLLAADGARSPVRSMLGLRLKGENYEGRYVIADIRMASDFPAERRAFFDSPGNPGGTVLIHKQPENIWRVDYQLAEGESEEEAIREENIRARVQAILADIGHDGAWELEWWSIYSANTLALDDYRRGRVFFIGDAAHIVPIFGVRGLNNGLADAQNIGWKLAYLLNGLAGEALLGSYTPERRGATLDVFAHAGKSTRFMTPPTRGFALMRQAALSLGVDHEFPRALANPRQMQPYTYRDSPISDPAPAGSAGEEVARAGPGIGAFAPNAALAGGGYLLEGTGRGFALVHFHDPAFGVEEAALRLRLAGLDPHLTVLTIGPGGIEDRDGAIAAIYGAGAGTVFLLRPDNHLAGRWDNPDAEAIAGALARCLGRNEP